MQPHMRQLCDELLGMAEKERVALGAGNIDDLEQFLTRKLRVLEELSSIGYDDGQTTQTSQATVVAAELRDVFERVRNAHNQARDGIRSMLDACENEIVGLRTDQKAHRAYHRGRTGGTSPGDKPGNRRGRSGGRRHVA